MALIKNTQQSTDGPEETLDCVTLTQHLRSGNADQRRRAAREIIKCEDAVTHLLATVAGETDSSVRQVLFSSLIQIGDSDVIDGLVDFLRSEDTSLRNDAIEAIKHLPDEVAPVMARLLSDADPDVRIFTVNVLESLCHDDVEKWLIEVIRKDAHVNVCSTAVDLLGEVGTREALEDLQALKNRFSEEPYIQFAADLAIRRINGD